MDETEYARALAVRESAIAEGVAEWLSRQAAAWADGRRGDGILSAEGFTVTETTMLRILAARGYISLKHPAIDAVQRHICNIRRKLPPTVAITTIPSEGYRVDAGRDDLLRLLLGSRLEPARGAAGKWLPRPYYEPANPPSRRRLAA